MELAWVIQTNEFLNGMSSERHKVSYQMRYQLIWFSNFRLKKGGRKRIYQTFKLYFFKFKILKSVKTKLFHRLEISNKNDYAPLHFQVLFKNAKSTAILIN